MGHLVHFYSARALKGWRSKADMVAVVSDDIIGSSLRFWMRWPLRAVWLPAVFVQ